MNLSKILEIPLDHEQRMWLGLYHGECTGCNKFNPEDKVRLLKRGEKPSGAAKLE